jgi:hypothetical protein
MKLKSLLTAVILIAAISNVYAQKEKHFEVGIHGGYGSVWIINQNNYGLTEMDYEYTWGGGYNLQLVYNFTENIGLFTEVGIMNQGQDYTDEWGNQSVERSLKLNYLNVPLFFKYSYGESVARFRLLVGPQFSFLQKAEQAYTINGKDFHQNVVNEEGESFDAGAKDIKDRYNSSDIFIVLDLGADIFLVEDMLYLSTGIRMAYGLTDINASAYQMKNGEGNYDPSHNASVVFRLGINYIIAGGN